ncbi:hypothetical protein M5689_008757 [Euphorbia peplus]|nr:hypothetical protein M5689_008757 [Euphorbia peplus]
MDRVLSCVPVHQNDPDPAQAGNCVICTEAPVIHPSPEFCIADDSSLDPSHLPEWIQAGKALDCDWPQKPAAASIEED